MGIGSIAAKAALKVGGEVASLKLGSKLNSRHEAKESESEETYNHKLTIEERDFTLVRSFYILDEAGRKKYRVKTDRFKIGMPSIHLYDMAKNEIGRVTQKRPAFIGRTWNTYYAIRINGKKVGTVTAKLSLKTNLVLDMNGWKLKGDTYLDPKYTIYDADDNAIMTIFKDGAFSDEYAMYYNDTTDEVLGLLLMMTIDLGLHPKGDPSGII